MIEFWIVDEMSCVFLHTDQLLVGMNSARANLKSGTLVTFHSPSSTFIRSKWRIQMDRGNNAHITLWPKINKEWNESMVKWNEVKSSENWRLPGGGRCAWWWGEGCCQIAGCKDWKTSASASPPSSSKGNLLPIFILKYSFSSSQILVGLLPLVPAWCSIV